MKPILQKKKLFETPWYLLGESGSTIFLYQRSTFTFLCCSLKKKIKILFLFLYSVKFLPKECYLSYQKDYLVKSIYLSCQSFFSLLSSLILFFPLTNTFLFLSHILLSYSMLKQRIHHLLFVSISTRNY